MPTTATSEAMPIATPSADSAARSGRERRPMAPTQRVAIEAARCHRRRHGTHAAPRRVRRPRSRRRSSSMRRGSESAISRSCVITHASSSPTRAGRAAGRGSARRDGCRGCRSARRPASTPARRPARGRSPRAGARRPTARRPVPQPVARGRRGRAPPRPGGGARASRHAARRAAPPATLPTAFRPSSRWKRWNTKPIAAPAAPTAGGRTASPRRRRPAGRVPAVGRSSVPISCSSVDLPEPDGPTIADQLAGLDRQLDVAQRRRRRR